MQALKFTAATKTLQCVSNCIPVITPDKPNQVLVRVAFSGVCGTDLHIIQGQFPCIQTRPIILGHEFSGVVVEVRPEVQILKIGDKVAVDPNSGCLSCKFCRSGKPHFCKVGGINNTIGIFRDGGWAEYVIAPVHQVHKLPDSISLEQGALTEPLSCLSHGWDLINPIAAGSEILVMGAGIIGNLWACILHLNGFRKVTISETNATRLEQVKKLDLGFTLLTPDQLKANQSSNPDYCFDVVIDCTGNAEAVEHGFTLLGSGGKLCIFGCAAPDAQIKINPFEVYAKELTIVGVDINPFSFVKAIGFSEAMGPRYLDYDKLGVKVYKLEQYQEAMDTLKQGTIAKAVFKF